MASSSSLKVRVDLRPVMLTIRPLAPVMSTFSNSGERHRLLGRAHGPVGALGLADADQASPASFMMARRSLMSMLISPGMVITSEMDCTALAQHVVGLAESLVGGRVLVDHVEKAVVGDDQQGVHALAQLLDALLGQVGATQPLEFGRAA